MQLVLNKAVVFTNPATASGLKNYVQLAADYGDAEVRFAYFDTAWHLVGSPTESSGTERRVTVSSATGDYVVGLFDRATRKFSVTLTKVSEPGTVVCVDVNSTLVVS